MYPIICKIGPLVIYSYGLMLALAFSLGTFLIVREGNNKGFNPEFMFNLCLIILISGLMGARILYIILNLDYYFKNPLQIVMLNRGGFAWFGGLLSAILSVLIYVRKKSQDPYRIADLVIPYIVLAHAIGRIGCLLHGCCYGRQTVWIGIYFAVHNEILIPTQLYSALTLIFIYIILRLRQLRVHRKSEIFYLYLFLYSSWRFFIEFFRADSKIFILGLSLFQIISVVLFIVSLIMLIRVNRQTI